MMKYYHGTNKLFNEFNGLYSRYAGKIYISPCRMMALAYTSGNGYIYEVEISEKDVMNPDEIGECGCLAFIDTNKLKITGCEKIENNLSAMWQSECGRNILRIQRKL